MAADPMLTPAHVRGGFATAQRVLSAPPAQLSRARAVLPPQCLLTQPEEVGPVLALLHWFKHEFFTWVNSPACERCGDGDAMAFKRAAGAETGEERDGLAGVVEVHACGRCGGEVRFPRFNDPFTLLRTRRGRCGEWANCFFLLLVASGQRARYVVDVTDHVWCEVWAHREQRWVHCDPCENAYDAPLMYSTGWGKKLSYVMAFGPNPMDIADCTRRYVPKLDVDVLARRVQSCGGDVRWYAKLLFTPPHGGGCEAPPQDRSSLKPEELMGRTSGGLAWRRERQELGDETLVEKRNLVVRCQVTPPVLEVCLFDSDAFAVERDSSGWFIYDVTHVCCGGDPAQREARKFLDSAQAVIDFFAKPGATTKERVYVVVMSLVASAPGGLSADAMDLCGRTLRPAWGQPHVMVIRVSPESRAPPQVLFQNETPASSSFIRYSLTAVQLCTRVEFERCKERGLSSVEATREVLLRMCVTQPKKPAAE